MNILIPMAGAGKRFEEAGYTVHKPLIPTIYRKTGEKVPMVVCATKDLPDITECGDNIIYIDRDFHRRDGVEDVIRAYYPKSRFITLDYLTEGQASTCLLAKGLINNQESLLIAACDNGMVFEDDKLKKVMKSADVIVFTYRHNEGVLENPNAHGWVIPDTDGRVAAVSVKKAVSDIPTEDHAIVATFWFKHGSIFVDAAEKMISENDRINNEFYVDQVLKHLMDCGYEIKVFEIDQYLGWGTPSDYENYMNTINYWYEFIRDNRHVFIE